ncbi:Pls/PosA family non-ribosomal peptide synthetase [Corynebacterium sp. H78]|uniref:Pls/PosA family non-ribosomal peptide synthetase n=1 Tax=Corynebacterium sp. H78 TaxID=3133417 RepID=UPI0030A5C60D
MTVKPPSVQDHPTLAIYGLQQEPEPRTLVDIFQATANAHPNAIAIEGIDGTLSYRETQQRIDVIVRRLAEIGIGRGDRIGIRVPSGTVDLYLSILATIHAGAAYVPVDWDDPDSRADTVWEEANVNAVFGAGLELTMMGSSARSASLSPERPTVQDDAWIIFTSGSTGKPKGVAITHRSAAALVDVEADLYLANAPLGPQDRVMAGLSVAFDASCEEMWLAWRSGAALVTAPRDVVRSGEDLGNWIVRNNITAVSTVPTLASFWPIEDLNKVRLLIVGGEACPMELVEKYDRPGREMWNTYGPTEATVIASAHLMTTTPPIRIGRPIDGWQLTVVDENEQPVKWGETGELVIGGIGLGRYLDPEKDAEKYAPLPSLGSERAYRSGDLVRAEREGLVFAGRTDDQIKINGVRTELGEVDAHLTALPNVQVGAAAIHKTDAGADVLVGYLMPEPGKTIDIVDARRALATTLRGGTPSLCIVDEMPMKTSGKVDRKALPWPLPASATGGTPDHDLPPELTWLGDLWTSLLGPVPLELDSNFIDLGGTSVAVAMLVSELRKAHPGVEIAKIYADPTIRGMAEYLDTLADASDSRYDEPLPEPRPIPWFSGVYQSLVVMLFYAWNALRYVAGTLIVVWILATFFNAHWMDVPPLWPIAVAYVVLFSMPGRVLTTAVVSRILCFNIKPGRYLRGGLTHMRIWTAQRFLELQKLENLYGTPQVALFHRLMGNTVGKRTLLWHAPSVTGLVSIGDDSSIGHETDLQAYYLVGDTLIVDEITIENNVRIGARVFVNPGTHIQAGAEVMPGSAASGTVEGNMAWGGSPLFLVGPADESWPVESAYTASGVKHFSAFTNWVSHLLAMMWVPAISILAITPSLLIVLPQVHRMQRFERVFPIFATWVPVFVILTMATWIGLVALTLRFLSVFIQPGYYPQRGPVGVAMYLAHVLMQRSLISTYVLYASFVTPYLLRLFGARVERNVEISTVETIPHLTAFEEGTFMADHSMVSATRYRNGWLHVGSSVIGERSFVGNSGIVGPDRDMAPDSLVAVLSSLPANIMAGTSWIGRVPTEIPRQRVQASLEATYNPPLRLKVARVLVEVCRLLPHMITAWLELAIVWILAIVYLRYGRGLDGMLGVLLWAWPTVFAAGVISSTIPIIVKWLLIHRFKPSQNPLFSAFVWLGELSDAFNETLAVPSLIRMSLGSPMYNLWLRLMGTRIGKNVWCESWWLPEFDLIELDDGVTINRGTVLQTHLFHDRVMSLESVHFEAGSSLGPNSFILPGATVGCRTTIGPGSLVMRQESLPADTRWGGNPVQLLTESTTADLAIAQRDNAERDIADADNPDPGALTNCGLVREGVTHAG